MRSPAALSRAQWRSLATAAVRLAQAKALHLRLDAPAILARLRRPAPAGRGARPPDPAMMNWALGAVSRRLPWRSDCLVQALAGKLWCDAAGVQPTLRLAARRDGDGDLTAHAWLEIDGAVATGGPVSAELAAFTEAAAARAADAAAGGEDDGEDDRGGGGGA